MGWVGNNYWTHPLFFSRHLTLQNLRNINFLDFSIFDALMHAWWFMAAPLGPQGRAASGHEPWASPGLPWPWALSHEPWTIKHASRAWNIEKSRRKLFFLRFCKVRCRDNKGGWVLELFPTNPTYQNPINMNPGPVLLRFLDFSRMSKIMISMKFIIR